MTGKALFERIFSNWIVKVLSVAAAVVLFLFYRIGSLEERFIGVPVEYEINDEVVVTDVSTANVRIDIRGSRDEIFLILGEDIRAHVDLRSYTREGIFRAPVLLETTGSAETVEAEMIVEPLEITVTLEQKVERELTVVPDLGGYPAVGYELVQYLVTPEMVTVTGPKSSLNGLERLETAEIDLTGRMSDFALSVPIRTDDDLIVFSGSGTVEVRGFIREVIIERTFEAVALEYINLAPRLELEDAVPFGSVRLSGPQLLVESLRSPDLGLVVDCGTVFSRGVYELPVAARTPPGIIQVAIQPPVVEIRVVEATPETVPEATGERAGEAVSPAGTSQPAVTVGTTAAGDEAEEETLGGFQGEGRTR